MTTVPSSADQLMARLLVVELPPLVEGVENPEGVRKAKNAFDLSLAFSALRCTLQYVVLPFLLPLIGLAEGVAVPITLAINVVAFGAIITSLRRFWRTAYKGRWRYLAIAGPALGVLIAFTVLDLIALVPK